MTSQVALVFIHSGDSDYLRHSLAQARSSNPKSVVFLIGDDTTAGKYPDIEHVHYRDYVAGAREFAESYRHLNSNERQFELFCLMRWFVLRDFMRQRAIASAVYLDSDIMLYEEIHYEHFRYYDYDLAVTGVAPPVLINNIRALEAFCSLMSNAYRDEIRLRFLEQCFRSLQAQGRPGGVCDMTFWELFVAGGEFSVADLSLPNDGAVYDRNIYLEDGFEMENGLKKVIWRDGKPHGVCREQHNLVRFKGLHFHGPAKELMGIYLDNRCRPEVSGS